MVFQRLLLKYSVFCGIWAVFMGSVLMHPIALAESAFDYEAPALEDGTYPFRFTHPAMGTDFVFDIYLREGDVGYDDIAPIAKEAFHILDSLEREISSWISNSDTGLINKFAAEEPVPVRKRTFELLEFSAKIYEDTGGVFDITVGPLIHLWNSSLVEGKIPTSSEIAEALTRVGMNKVKLDPKTREVSFAQAGLHIGFGGIGKGLALDMAAAYLKQQGITSALLSGGGSSVLTIGAPPGKEFWIIGINNPYNEDKSLERLQLKDQALSTSACYRQLAGVTEKPCGIYDPRTGQIATGLASATVIAQSGMQTDALSTSFYVMGVEGVRAYCERHPEVSAVLVENAPSMQLRATHINRK